MKTQKGYLLILITFLVTVFITSSAFSSVPSTCGPGNPTTASGCHVNGPVPAQACRGSNADYLTSGPGALGTLCPGPSSASGCITQLNNYYSTDSYSYACPATAGNNLPYVVGWGYSCLVPAGAITPSDSTCIAVPNLIGEVIDDIATLGIGIDMMENFCSVGAGWNGMEGALIGQCFFDQQCSNATTPKAKKNCQSILLRGYNYVSPGGQYTIPNTTTTATAGALGAPGAPFSSSGLQRYTTEDLCGSAINLERPVVDSNGNFMFTPQGQQVFCPIMRCNIPTSSMLSLYYDRATERDIIMAALGGGIGAIISAIYGDCSNLVELDGTSGSTGVGMWGIVQLEGQVQGDMICTQMLFPTGWTTMACKPLPIPMTTYAPSDNCYVKATSCSTGETNTKSFFPFTALMMECVTDLVTFLFQTPPCGCGQSPLAAFQGQLKTIVQMLLVLYVVILGFRVAVGGALPKKSEFFTFVLKFSLVAWFAVGGLSPNSNNCSSPGSSPGSSPNSFTNPNANLSTFCNENPATLSCIYLDALQGMNSFASILIGNSNATSTENGGTDSVGLCQYPISSDPKDQYPDGYGYLALWDALDCRIAFYLGIASPMAGGGLQAMTSNMLSNSPFTLIWSAFFAFYFPLVVFMVCFGVFLLSVIVYLVHVYILSMIALAIVVFVGPIFIPMALFDKTKGWFDEWFKLIIAYVLYPTIIMAFISIMISTYDSIIYSGCSFTIDSSVSFPYWTFTESSLGAGSPCLKSVGYIVALVTSGTGSQVTQFAGGLFNFIRLAQDSVDIVNLLEAMMLCAFFAFLFYYFSKQLSAFAADISGATNLNKQAISPTALVDALKAVHDGDKDALLKSGDNNEDGTSASKSDGDADKDGTAVSKGNKGGSSRSGIQESKF